MNTSGSTEKSAKVAVIGGGSFGSALADILGHNGHRVALQFRTAEAAAAFNASHINAKYLPGITLSANITATADLAEAVHGATLVLVCVPSPWRIWLGKQGFLKKPFTKNLKIKRTW